ncbi:MAG: winged helix-turn-helix domain-containing protein [Thermoplasmata archaeon]
MRILVVDDDAVFREELGELLSDDGHTVTRASSVPKAVELLEHEEVDVVLTDLKMPRHGGLELVATVRQRWPRTVVIVVTGFATVETAVEALKLGALDYLRKPFRLEEVHAALALASQQQAFESPPDSGRDPEREARALASSGRYDVLLLSDPPAPPAPHLTTGPLDPDHPADLFDRAHAFILEHPHAAVVLSGGERMVARHRLEEIVELLDRLRSDLAGHGPLRIGFLPAQVTRSAAAALGAAVTESDTHATLEALANPIRRKVLERLAEAPSSFGDAMKAAHLDDSPKLAFHMNKLLECGLIRHEGDAYQLSPRGRAAVRLLDATAFLPPAREGANLAFPRSGGNGSEPP